MNRYSVPSARDAIRANNQQAIFFAVHRHGPISRSEIATRLNLSPAAVTNITSELIARELIHESEHAEPSGVGRPAILLKASYDQAEVAGIKLSNAGITCARTNLNAEVLTTTYQAVGDTSPETVVRATEQILGEPEFGRTSALGLSLPGVVDNDHLTVRHSPLFGWGGVPIGTILSERLGMPVVIENDVNALALAEAWFGYGRDHESFLVVTLGRGIGLGIVLDGEVYRGPGGGAGELGHILLDPAGPDTRYARAGTLEAYLSDDALLRDARNHALLPDDATPEDLVALAADGDAAALDLYRCAGAVLGRALSILANIFAPSLIILGGEGMRAADYLLPEARSVLRSASFGDLGERVQLVVDTWGDDAWARGAAGLAARRHLVQALSRVGGG